MTGRRDMVGGLREVGSTVARQVTERAGRAVGRLQESSPLDWDLLESEHAYRLVFDAPGAAASDVQVRYADGAVLVRIDRFRGIHGGFEMRFPGRGMVLDGRAELPDDARVDPEAASAKIHGDGTLTVDVPKVEGSDDEPADDGHGESDDAVN